MPMTARGRVDVVPLFLSIAPFILYDAADYVPHAGVAVDSSGNARHSTPQSTTRPTRGNGIAGRATIKFPGSANQAIIAPATTFTTFSIWMVVRCTGTIGYLAVLKDDAGNDGGYLYGSTGSTINVHRATSTVSSYNYTSNWAVDNVARSVIWTFDGTHAGNKLYIGGGAVSLTTTVSGAPNSALLQEIYIGASDAGTAPSTMELAAFGLYPGVLPAADIANLSAHSLEKFGV